MMMRRRGAPLLRAAATTAVVAGTAGAVRHRQETKYANQAAEAQGEQQAQYDAAYQEGLAAAQAAPPPAAAPAATAPAAGGGMQDQIMQLANLHAQGILTDEEFAAAKQKVISGG
jgi:putative oligomerization/nucleic acid binding protein